MPPTETRTPFDCGAPQLDAESLRALAAVLPSIYAETQLACLPGAFADALARLIPAGSHGIVVHDFANGQRYWHLLPATPEHESLVPGFFANFHEFAPAEHRRRTGSGAALALSDFVTPADLRRLRIYRDYYGPLGLEDDLNINVRHGDIVICAAVLRSQRGFRPHERELMNALRPHFRQAWINAETVAEIQACAVSAPASAREFLPEPLEIRYGLTPRESEVLRWVAQGKTNSEVATILGIRTNTVRTHLERIFVKLGVETRHAASLCALESLGPSGLNPALVLSG
jgi:DNA-binding CsgD family transcriptional regulator